MMAALPTRRGPVRLALLLTGRPRLPVLADGVPADLAVQHLVQRARPAVLPGRDGARAGHAWWTGTGPRAWAG